MARGCAFQAVGRWPEIDEELGDAIKKYGNVPSVLLSLKNMMYDVVSFPVKPDYVTCSETKDNLLKHKKRRYKAGSRVPGWASVADIEVIKNSCRHLVNISDSMGYKKVILPRPGCGAGELDWEFVAREIAPILDDRFHIITLSSEAIQKTRYY